MPLPFFYRAVVPKKVFREDSDLSPKVLAQRLSYMRLSKGEARVIAKEIIKLKPVGARKK